jgi:CubicO group peptidase (beta-lactamase class C family)
MAGNVWELTRSRYEPHSFMPVGFRLVVTPPRRCARSQGTPRTRTTNTEQKDAMSRAAKTLAIILLMLLALPALVLGGAALAGFSPSYLINAPAVATGMGAKLLCSARYVSGFSQEQASADLVQYSPVLAYLRVEYDEPRQAVTTSLFGISSASARAVAGIGCANDYRGHEQRNGATLRPLLRLDSHWPHGSRVETLEPALQDQLAAMLEQDNAAGLDTRALLVVRQGSVVAEAYAQGAGPETALLGWSMAKSLGSVMIGNLEMRGLLDTQAAPDFPGWQPDSRADIRVVDLLTMTDGLDFSEEYSPGDDATAMLFTVASASDYVLRKPAVHLPGTNFNYSSGTANLLSRLHYERTGGTLQASYQDYLTHIAQPLGFQQAVFETDASGVLVGSSYLYAPARDWARLGQMMLNGGVLNGQRIVTEDWVRRSVTPNDSHNGPAYGYQWWLNSGGARLRWPDLPEDAYAAQGNRQQHMMIIPSQSLIIVRLGWTSGTYPVNQRFAQIADAAGSLAHRAYLPTR